MAKGKKMGASCTLHAMFNTLIHMFYFNILWFRLLYFHLELSLFHFSLLPSSSFGLQCVALLSTV